MENLNVFFLSFLNPVEIDEELLFVSRGRKFEVIRHKWCGVKKKWKIQTKSCQALTLSITKRFSKTETHLTLSTSVRARVLLNWWTF